MLIGNKVIRTFRMPPALVNVLGREANLRGLDLTALVLRILHGYLTWFALPDAAAAQLEADRQVLKMDRNQYLAHLLYHRCLALREHGLGFDDPRNPGSTGGGGRTPAEGPVTKGASGPNDLPRALGAAGGGAHGTGQGLVPGAGVWPYGVKENKLKR